MTTPPAGTAASDTFTHLLLPFDGMEQFLGGAVPFLSAGVDAGDRVLAVCGPAREALLRDALGPAAGGVEFTEAAAWYEHPSRTLSDCLSDACDTARQGRRLRLLGEPVWATRPPLEVVEWQRAEAVLNIAFRGTGAAIMCPYAASLPASVVAAGRKTHPETVRGARAVANPGFLNPWTFCGQCDDEPLPPPPARRRHAGHRPPRPVLAARLRRRLRAADAAARGGPAAAAGRGHRDRHQRAPARRAARRPAPVDGRVGRDGRAGLRGDRQGTVGAGHRVRARPAGAGQHRVRRTVRAVGGAVTVLRRPDPDGRGRHGGPAAAHPAPPP
ncbi:MEDS domain-containing protein [Actinomadura madurae]|nr:MEDS domain-containing protein [Actinomadura madurae]MCP9953681.1 MEDS domain-containing protein [Actinomadura madurae]